jgi:hypothetical protein
MVPSLVDIQMGMIGCNTKNNFKEYSNMVSCFAIDGPYKRREKALLNRINTDSEKARRRKQPCRRAACYEGSDNHFLSVPPAIGWRFIATRLGWLGLLLRRAHLCKEVRVATKSREQSYGETLDGTWQAASLQDAWQVWDWTNRFANCGDGFGTHCRARKSGVRIRSEQSGADFLGD